MQVMFILMPNLLSLNGVGVLYKSIFKKLFTAICLDHNLKIIVKIEAKLLYFEL